MLCLGEELLLSVLYQACHLTVTYCLHMQSAAQQLSLHLWSWNYSAHGSCLTPSFLLQCAAQAEDPYFKEALYSTLVDLKATQQLLKMDSPGLLTYLRDAGGLPEGEATRRGAPIGPPEPSPGGCPPHIPLWHPLEPPCTLQAFLRPSQAAHRPPTQASYSAVQGFVWSAYLRCMRSQDIWKVAIRCTKV